jgi:hypothetical protein
MYEDDVFGLDVTVQYLECMELLYGIEKVADDEGSGLFGKGLSVSEDVEELSIAAQLHHDVELFPFLEVAVDVDDVRVLHETLDLQLADELAQEVVAQDPLLLDHFQTHHHARVQFTREIGRAEFALSQPPNYFKVGLAQALLTLEFGRRLGLVAQEGGKGLLGLVSSNAISSCSGGGFLQVVVVSPASRPTIGVVLCLFLGGFAVADAFGLWLVGFGPV